MNIANLYPVEYSSLSTSLDRSPNLLELSSVAGLDHLEDVVNSSSYEFLNSKPELE